jgi:hypothetical protein
MLCLRDGQGTLWDEFLTPRSRLASPITLRFGPIVAYNVVITAAIALSASCAFLAVPPYAHRVVAPLIGYAVYGFSPYVVPQAAGHLHLAAASVPPLFLLVLDELLRRRGRSPRLLGVLAFVQGLTSEEVVLTSAILGGVRLACSPCNAATRSARRFGRSSRRS